MLAMCRRLCLIAAQEPNDPVVRETLRVKTGPKWRRIMPKRAFFLSILLITLSDSAAAKKHGVTLSRLSAG